MSERAPETSHVLIVRRGVGANCSSIGSAVEMLFLSATIGAAILAAVSAALPLAVAVETPGTDEKPPAEPPAEPPAGGGP